MKATREQVLSCPLGPNDAHASTVGSYMFALACEVWVDEEGFSSRRPFGERDWRFVVIDALLTAGLATTATEAMSLVTHALLPVVNDPALPAGLQGRTQPSWWDPNHDPFEDQQWVGEGPSWWRSNEKMCTQATCDCWATE